MRCAEHGRVRKLTYLQQRRAATILALAKQQAGRPYVLAIRASAAGQQSSRTRKTLLLFANKIEMGLRTTIRTNVAALRRASVYRFPLTKPRRIVFDHLHKCGGSTVSNYLVKHYPDRHVFTTGPSKAIQRAEIRRFQGLPESARRRYRLIIGHETNSLFDFVHPSSLRVTMLRDPVQRIVSHYFYAKETPLHDCYARIHADGMGVAEYAASNMSVDLRNWYTIHFSGLSLQEAEQRPSEAVDKAADTVLNEYDLVGLLENFSAFIARLKQLANLAYRYDGQRVNETRNRPALDDVSESAIKTIEQVNFLDIELYQRIKQSL